MQVAFSESALPGMQNARGSDAIEKFFLINFFFTKVNFRSQYTLIIHSLDSVSKGTRLLVILIFIFNFFFILLLFSDTRATHLSIHMALQVLPNNNSNKKKKKRANRKIRVLCRAFRLICEWVAEWEFE